MVASDAVWRVRSVHAEAGTIDAHPNDANRTVRARREEVGIFATNAGFQHRFVPPEVGHENIARDAPCARWNWKLGRTGRAWKTTGKISILIECDKAFTTIQHKMPKRLACGSC